MDKPDIVYEDDNIIVCNKKAGVASQSERSFANDLTSMLMTYLVSSGRKCNVHIINRLDKPVEGLVLYALNKKAAAGLSALSGEHAIEKYYYAVVTGRPENKGNYTDYLLKNPGLNVSHVADADVSGAKKASLNYETIETKEISGREYSLVRIRLLTGRHHQIRVQFAAHGHALYGDTKYNPDFAGCRGVQLMLCAYRIAFANPAGADRITVQIRPGGKFTEFEYFHD